jgi:hypothetical protein
MCRPRGCHILPFKAFWVRRMALNRRNYRQVVETTVKLAQKASVLETVGKVVNELKDEAEDGDGDNYESHGYAGCLGYR